MQRSLLSALTLSLGLCACGPELNPPRPPPAHGQLAPGGVWVAYNLGCEVGCDEIKRGDRILAVDGRPVSSGAEIDQIDLARNAPLKLQVAKYGGNEIREVTIVARPNELLPPIAAAPPMFTVGADALDRAPDWARSKLFGHAIPAIRFYRADEPRGFVTGRELYGRAALLVIWELPPMIEERRNSLAVLPAVYAQMQEFSDELAAAGVDTYFVTDFRAEPAFRDTVREHADPGPNGFIPIFQLYSSPNNGNTVGLEGSAADIREAMFDYLAAPVVVIFDRRGIVRFHTRGFPAGAKDTLSVAIDFALHSLTDAPAPRALASIDSGAQ
ncbi:hypothetical protein [Nannocystis punicea]|uniref:PDZ domain-containing protein n=1 Tax=Nannocystis punicea TaxID=2995304 RepID=A0ABY7GZT0_9BACT|nr:hypothetical protein [Nannocystis poenicansa]WAS92502.1 hypothetical protein O0S08_40500 [Nannocystis poenicansa]